MSKPNQQEVNVASYTQSSDAAAAKFVQKKMSGDQWRQLIMKSREDFEKKHKIDIDQALKISLEEAERDLEKKAIEMSIRE